MVISSVSPVLNTCDIIVILMGYAYTPACCDESNKYLKRPQSSPKECLIALKFISSAPGLLFVFRKRRCVYS